MANRLTDPFKTGADVYFPSMRPDWRDEIGDESDPDDELIQTPDDVIAVLGFDPAVQDS